MLADMNLWLVAALVLAIAMVPCGLLILRSASLDDAVVALQMAGVVTVLLLVLLAQALSRPSFYDLALALTVLSFPAGMMFAYFLECWFR